MFSKIGLFVILTLPMPASGQTIDQFSAGDWTGTAQAVNGKFLYCTITGPKPRDPSWNQLSFSESADGRISISLQDLHPPPAKCPDGGFLGSGYCSSITGAPAPSSTAVMTTVDVRLGVEGAGGALNMKSYKGTTYFVSDTVMVDLPEGDDLITRMKSGHYINGVIPSMQTLFMADLGASVIPLKNSAAYAAIEALRKCVASHAK
jgi:hypothetical protein